MIINDQTIKVLRAVHRASTEGGNSDDCVKHHAVFREIEALTEIELKRWNNGDRPAKPWAMDKDFWFWRKATQTEIRLAYSYFRRHRGDGFVEDGRVFVRDKAGADKIDALVKRGKNKVKRV